MAIDEFVKKASEGMISEYSKNAYSVCKPYLGTLSLEEFAARTSNYNPNKAGIGEKSQLEFLESKFPSIKKLPSHGKDSYALFKLANGRYTIIKGEKTNLGGVKSFDAIADLPNEVIFFILKTVDIGPFSDSTGGGHQTNVQDEITNIISHARQQKLTLDKKPVKIYVVVDGRSASNIIAAARKASNGCTHIVINEGKNI